MSAITITFGDCAENNVGMQQLGEAAEEGFSYEDLVRAKVRFEAAGCRCELVDLISAGGVETLGDPDEGPEPGYVLIVRAGVDALLGAPGAADAMRDEQRALPADTKALFRGEVKNKLARHNLCFAGESQEPDYEAGRGRVVAFRDVPHTAAAREAIGRFFGDKGRDLLAEGNYYYRPGVCGIGFHGDGERRKVVALRLGTAIPLHYQWFLRSRPAGYRVVLSLNHGDLYAMSEKAVGYDWKRPSIPTLRHAAGARKYLTIEGHPAAVRPVRPPRVAAPAVAPAAVPAAALPFVEGLVLDDDALRDLLADALRAAQPQ
jgi:hypothetical protein